MARSVFGGDEVVSELFYGSVNGRVVGALNDITERSSRFINEAGRRFFDTYERFRERSDVRQARRLADTLSERVSHYWQEDTIRYLPRVEDVQNAPPTMKRWVMANPEVRRKYREGILDGYQGDYFDIDPNCEDPKLHFDYCQVMEGVECGEDGDEHLYYYSNAIIDDEDTKELTYREQFAILRTWDVAEVGLYQGRDVTSVWDASI